jgi:hypothetical protein
MKVDRETHRAHSKEIPRKIAGLHGRSEAEPRLQQQEPGSNCEKGKGNYIERPLPHGVSTRLLYQVAYVLEGYLPKDRKQNSKAPDTTLKTPPTLRLNANDLSIHCREGLIFG